MYDNICKFLAEEFPTDIATWLLGEPIVTTELSPRELSLEPIRTDSLILRQSDNLVLHAEFQTDTDDEIPFRMTDYRLRVYRRYLQKRMYQVVIYLKKTSSQLVYQNTFTLERLRHEFDVIRLWEQPSELFLDAPGLLSFAVLGQNEDKTAVLREVSRKVDTLTNKRVQSNIAATSSILAGLVLNQDLIGRILRRDIMKESVVYQEIVREAREEGMQQGIQQIALNLLRAGMTVEQVAGYTGLSVEKVEELLS